MKGSVLQDLVYEIDEYYVLLENHKKETEKLSKKSEKIKELINSARRVDQ
jgi:hypothetical protein